MDLEFLDYKVKFGGFLDYKVKSRLSLKHIKKKIE